MRRTILVCAAVSVLALGACTSSVEDEKAQPTVTVTVTQTPTNEATRPTDSPAATPSEASSSDPAASGAIEGKEVHGKILLTSGKAAEGASAQHGKIVVGQGGCIAFVPVPGGGKPTPIIAPSGAEYNGKDTVTINGQSYRFGQQVDIQGVAKEADVPADFAQRCGTNVMWLSK